MIKHYKASLSMFFFFHCIKWIYSILPCVCSVIDHRRLQKVLRTSSTHSCDLCAFFYVLTTFWHHLWSNITEETTLGVLPPVDSALSHRHVTRWPTLKHLIPLPHPTHAWENPLIPSRQSRASTDTWQCEYLFVRYVNIYYNHLCR